MPEFDHARTNRARAERVAQTLLYGGHALYPYRASAIKDRSRWTLGSLFPESYGGEPSRIQVQCLLRGPADADVRASARFLQIAQCRDWQEAIEREVGPGPFEFRSGGDENRWWLALQGELRTAREQIGEDLWRMSVEVINRSRLAPVTSRGDALRCAFASTHVLLEACGGEFVSIVDPPPDLRKAAADCCNEGAWPVLIGSEGASDTVLASPIILYDNPQMGLERPGAQIDAAEIDEILSLRVLTSTDEEKREAAALTSVRER